MLHIGNKNEMHEYKIDGLKLDSTCEEKDLLVFFSKNFKPSLNCDKTSESANRIIGVTRRNIK